MIEAYIPNALIGISGDPAFAKKATEVVLDVTAIAFAARLTEYAMRLCGLCFMTGINSD